MKTFIEHLQEKNVTNDEWVLLQESLTSELTPELEAKIDMAIDEFMSQYTNEDGIVEISKFNEDVTNEGFLGSILGGFSGDYLGYIVCKWLLQEEISPAEKKVGQATVDTILTGSVNPVAYGSGRLRGMMGNVPTGHEMNALDAISDTQHLFRGGDMGSYDYNAKRAMKNFNILPFKPGGPGSIDPNTFKIIQDAGSTHPLHLSINAPTNVSPNMTTIQGAKTKTDLNVVNVGGGFSGDPAITGMPHMLS